MTIKITAICWLGILVLTPMNAWGQQTFTTRVTYDNLAQIERFEFPDGSCVQYEYHNEMRVASRVTYQSGTESQTFVSDVTLNESGLVTSVEIPNGQKTYDFDSLNQLTEQRFDYGGVTRYHAKNMAYNHLGGLKRLTRQDNSITGTIQYGYTEQGQLRTFKLGSQTATYRYDAHGNLTAVNGFSTVDDLKIPSYSAGNNAYKDNNRNRNWDYDAEGRLLKDDRHQYYYDLTGRLAMVRDLATGIPLQTYLYDGAGNRVRTSDIREGSVTYTVRDGSGAIITEKVDHSTGPDRTTNTIHHNGETIATWTREEGAVTPETEQIFNDYLGSPAVVISDTEIKNHEYGPFGRQMSEPRNVGSHGYTGHEDDEGTALTYMKARYYDASTARFLTPDPARDFNPYLPASYNLYEYVRNDPINFIDPTGESIHRGNLTDEQQSQVLAEFSKFTGYEVGENGIYFNENGFLTIAAGAEFSGGSATARESLSGYIKDPFRVTLGSAHYSKTLEDVVAFGRASKKVPSSGLYSDLVIDFGDFADDSIRISNGINLDAFGLGTTLFHELRHNFTGEKDPKGLSDFKKMGKRGPQVEFVNIIRGEIGLPLRFAYDAPIFNRRLGLYSQKFFIWKETKSKRMKEEIIGSIYLNFKKAAPGRER